MTIYRSITKPANPETLITYRTTARSPGNVPYLVDNLWEWKRSESFPNRRYSVYASPDIELAQKLGGSGDGKVHRVEMVGNFKAAQIQLEDSRYHSECKSLKRLILKRLDQSWIDASMETKVEAGRLWIPCLSKFEVESLFNDVGMLKKIKDEIWDTIKYWEDVTLINEEYTSSQGEVFFEPFDGYRLIGIQRYE